MDIDSILVQARTICSLKASSKKRAFEMAAKHIHRSEPTLETKDIYRGLIEREKLGSTAIGDGVAIPHCRLDMCKDIVGALFLLRDPIDFLALDEKPVNIMFILLVPTSEPKEHLATLAMLAEKFQIDEYGRKLRASKNSAELYKRALSPLFTNKK